MQEKTKKYIAFALVLMLGLSIGFSAGFAFGVKWVIKFGLEFLQIQGVDFSLTGNQIADLVLMYQVYIQQHQGSGTRPPLNWSE